MTGTVQIKKDRPNYYIVLDYIDPAGKRKRPWISTDIPIKGNNKRVANTKLKEVLNEYDSQSIDLSKDILFTDFMTQWLETRISSKAIKITTHDGYERVLNAHIIPYFKNLKLKVRDLTPAHIQQYVNDKMKTLSPNTILKHLRNISTCLDSAIRHRIIAFNPVKRIEMPKKIKYTGAKHYNEKQIEQLLNISKGDPLEIVIFLTVFYGLRRSEVLGLKWSAIDFENDAIAINHTVLQGSKKQFRMDSTKNDSSNADVPLATIITDNLKRWKSQQLQHKQLQPHDYIDEGYVCTQIDGSLIKPHYVSAHFKILLAKHKMPHIRFHDLRHSSARYLKYLGFDLKDIQIWLRHGNFQTTANIYMNLDMDEKRGIADTLNGKFQKFDA
jgi:integrase